MTSWVYVFSRFTPEALLFEILLISILIAGYAAFWILHKRKYGAANADGVMKTYMNELIQDAEKLRAQLFGILGNTESLTYPQLPTSSSGMPMGNVSIDTALAKNIAVLEQRLTEQTSAMEAVIQDKARLESELADAKTATVTAVQAPGDGADVADLQSKLKALEDKLAEYSVIEDDLANLKRLQQENAQLKAALGGKAPMPAPEPVKPAEPVVPQVTGQSETIDQSSIDALFAPAPAEAPAPATPAAEASAPPAPSTADPLFEGLVDQVEKSLDPETPSGAAASAELISAPAPASSTSTSKPAPASIEKSDADLVAEFEKMLNG